MRFSRLHDAVPGERGTPPQNWRRDAPAQWPALARTERAFVRAPDSTVECIDGLRTPGSGTVSVLGLDPAGDRGEPRLCLGAQPQDSQLPERLRVGETLSLYS